MKRTRKKSILIVEDEKIVALDLRAILRSAGYAIADEVATGRKAIDAARRHAPDLVLMDIALKGALNGIDAARMIIADLDIPVIFLTANSDPATLEQAKLVSAYGYILKPFDERDIRTTVEMVLYKHKAEAEVKHQRRWLETTLRSIGDAVIATDRKGMVMFMNTVAEQLTGWSQSDAEGKKLTEVFVAEREGTGKRLPDPVKVVLRDKRPHLLTDPTILRSRTGAVTVIEDSAAPILDPSGEVTGVVLTFRDVTERRRAQDALNRSEQRYRALIENSSEIVAIVSGDGRLLYTSGAVTPVLGYPMPGVYGKELKEYLHPDELEEIRRQFEELLRRPGSSETVHIRVRRQDGAWRWFEAVATNLLKDPAVNGVVVNLRDISYRKRSEEQLSHLNERLDLIARVTGEVIGSLPIQKQVREMIDQVKKAFGIDAVIVRVSEEQELHLLASIGVDEHLLPKAIPSTEGMARQIMNGRRALSVKDVRKDPTIASLRERSAGDATRYEFISYAGAPLLIGHTVIGIIGLYTRGAVREFSATDLEHLQIVANHIAVAIANARLFREIREQNIEMTKHIEEQTRAEKLLRDSEERYRELVEHSPTAIFIHVNGVIRFVNHAGVILFGALTAPELIGRRVVDLLHPDFRDLAEERMQKVYENYTLPATEMKYLRLDGTSIDVEISSIPFTFDGQPAAQVIARNITERKQHEVALLESELRFRSLFENAKDAVFLADTRTGNIIDVNAEAERLLKRSRLEIIGKHQSFLHPPERAEEAEALFREQILMLGEHPIEFEVIDAEGGRVPVEIKASVVRLDDQRIISQAIFRDISERRFAEESLRESEHRFRTLAENLPGVVYLCRNDERFTMLYLNDQVEQLTGFAKEEFLEDRISFVDLYHPDDAPAIFRDVESALAVQQPYHLVYRIRHRSGEWRWVEEQGIGVFRDDQLLRLEGFLSDITDRKVAEAALKESEEKYRRLFEESKDGIYITSYDGELLEVNSAMMEILGYQNKEQMRGINVRDLYLNPTDRQKLLRELESNDYVKDFAVTLKRRDGEKAHVLITTVVIRDEQGVPLLFNGSMRDITEKRQLEQQLIQAQKMESIGTLAGGIAHDFNNLLAMILGTAELIKRHTKENHAVQKYIERIIEASERGSSISRQMLLFARPEQAELQPVAVHDVVQQVNEFLLHFLPKTIAVRCDLPPVSPVIMGDGGHLHQALLNLSINARDAMPNGGVITISVSRASGEEVRRRFPDASQHDYVMLSVSDTGSGMSDDVQQRIFEPFFSTKARGKGTGLGLAIVHGIVKLHQGFIGVESKLGVGTSFIMYFAPITVEQNEPTGTEVPMTVANSETILIVDDEVTLREILEETLREEGYNVYTAGDGIEALRVYAEKGKEIDLVITDLGMPNLSGEELFVKLYAMDPDVKVIVSSGYLDSSSKSGLLRRGIKDVLTKPYRFDAIFSTIRRTLDADPA